MHLPAKCRGSSAAGELAQSQAGRLRHPLNHLPAKCRGSSAAGELAQSQAGRLRHLLNLPHALFQR